MPVRLRGRHRYGVRLLIHAAGRVARLNPAALLSAVWRGARGISSGRSRFHFLGSNGHKSNEFFFLPGSPVKRFDEAETALSWEALASPASPTTPRGRHHPHDPRQEVAKPNSYTLQHDHHRFRIIRSATRRHPRGRGRDGPAVRIREARTACPNQTDVPTRQSLRFLQRLRRQRVFQVQGQVPKGDAVASRGAEGQARAEGEWFAELQMRSS